MKPRMRLLKLIVSFTLILLMVGAMLVVLSIFNAGLKWDIFGPRIEAFLYAVFGSCMALAGFGVAMTIIIAIREIVKDFKKLVRTQAQETAPVEAPRRAYALAMLAIVGGIGILVAVCAVINHAILKHRSDVFKSLAAEQIDNFAPKLLVHSQTFAAPPSSDAPHQLYDLVKSMDNLEFVRRTTIYVPDPVESTAAWGFTAWRQAYDSKDGFARFYIARDFEKAVRQALDGHPEELDRINQTGKFSWYGLIKNEAGASIAVVRMDGNEKHNFREYKLGR